MSQRDSYPAGVPCWVDTLQPNPETAMHFYAELFGWEFDGPGPMTGGAYYVARLRGRDVVGLGSLPPESSAVGWNTVIAVTNLESAAAAVSDAGGDLLLEATDAARAGRMAVARDPLGASFCLWEAQEQRGAQLVNEPSAWAMSTLQTPDAEKAMAFYAQVFGWRAETFELDRAMHVTLLRLPGYVGGEPEQPVPRDVVAVMVELEHGSGEPSRWSVDFWIEDAVAAAAVASELGGQVLVTPHEIPGFRRAILADPAGAAFSVSELRPA
jgi:uncharacterized protein